ncbi:MAG: GNAT family N-acetyltransferase [Mollicutes bacterium]|nr:GNAT family N-acetyltransferase [Mollicutes bacterium]
MISKYSKEDINDIENLGQEVNPKFKELFHINNLKEYEIIYVYKENDKILGFLHILDLDKVEILNLVVDSQYRNQRIASLLLDYLFDEVSKPVILEVRESNIPAINLYKKFNFMEIARREKYYENENAIIMERSDLK